MIIRFLMFLTYSLSSFSLVISSNEDAFLEEVYKNSTYDNDFDEHKKVLPSRILPAEEYHRIFKSNAPDVADNKYNFNVGRIEARVPPNGWCGSGVERPISGTGIIISATQSLTSKYDMEVEGLTALHVLGTRCFNWREFAITGFTPYRQCNFTPGQCIFNEKAVQNYEEDEEEKEQTFLKVKQQLTQYQEFIPIESVKIHPHLDVCLFQGKCKKSSLNNEHFTPKINVLKNSIYSQIDEDSFPKLRMIHYPSGDKQQRLSYGLLSESNAQQDYLYYKINAIKGSSGAPMFYEDSICGIHTTYDHIIPNEKVNYGGRDFDVTDRNKGVIVSDNMIQTLRLRPLIQINQH